MVDNEITRPRLTFPAGEQSMRTLKRTGCGLCLWTACQLASQAASMSNDSEGVPPAPQMPQLIEQFTADLKSLDRTYSAQLSPARLSRLEKFDRAELAMLKGMNFDALPEADKVDYLLLNNHLTADLHHLAIQKHQDEEMQPLLPFAETIEDLLENQRLMKRPDAEKAAALLSDMVKRITQAQLQLFPKSHDGTSGSNAKNGSKPEVDPIVAHRALLATDQLRAALKDWFAQYNGYDPEFTWWVGQPYQAAEKALDGYSVFIKEKLIGIAPDDKTTIIGDPVGRDALLNELADDMIPYTPEELIAIAQTEYDWCMREMLKASREMGNGDDWRAAVEKVKQMHVAPGEQPELIRKLVGEGSAFVTQNHLVTVPPLADETWRMIMMTPERQLVNPFFTGGNEISVSYPTNTMTFDQREMSMRGNNIPFARATAFHEMIPGHFLQSYMSARYHPYRRAFSTPFWSEGNALWWEMLFWDKGFDRTPEERVGALVWRMHRSARIIFTMNFHLRHWTPQQCVQLLIDKVGFEPDNATAEVRRSFDGSVGPLYQSAYLLGGLQFRALHAELVDSKKMTDMAFHDAILHENSMPVELLRASLEHEKVVRDFKTGWKFYGEHPTHP
jgi:Bacterial protein of unknown function (DUF885)